ncbi:MAG: class 1 fructose-bisphosphatase [Chloroflexi bacterium]|nr:class 1 fructose-bisphosphatase [Chloroflexota bacterium]MCL5275147.1 class 1 fructose-bisphosphatase [Chloroflexota bacterium]
MTNHNHAARRLTTIEQHILDEQHSFPAASGTLTGLLYDVALAGKIIAAQTTRAGLVEILGRTGEINVQGERVMKLDVLADEAIYTLTSRTGRLAALVSEEHADILPIPPQFPTGKYVLVYDPLDGSSNIDFNVSIGTIFAIYQRKSAAGPGALEDCLRMGRELVAAGYIVYSASTMLVYSAGHGVHGFTLDPNIGEFLMTHPDICIPEQGGYYSADRGHEDHWSAGARRFTAYLHNSGSVLSQRYVGSLAADFHRTLLSGGVFYYPAVNNDPVRSQGKLRLLYEAAPFAFIAEQAGGYASDGRRAILDIQPTSLHQRTPLFIGNRRLVEKAEEFIQAYG